MIRFATPADAARIGEIHVATWRVAYRGIVPESFLAAMSVEEHVARWRGRIEANPKLVFVHEQTGRIDGWVSMGAGRDEDAKSDGEVYALYVESGSWRKGVGRALMEKAEEKLSSRGLNRIVLWVLERNARARGFYESVGYSPDGRTKEITIAGTTLTELRYAKLSWSRGPGIPRHGTSMASGCPMSRDAAPKPGRGVSDWRPNHGKK